MKTSNFSYFFSKIIAFILIFISFTVNLSAQCTCTNGAAIGGMTPISGTTNIGVQQKQNLSLSLFTSYGQGNQYYSGTEKVPNIDVDEMSYSFSSILASYGINDKFTVEVETGYFLDKMQIIKKHKYNVHGFSHIGLTAKYNFYHSISKELEFTAGLLGKVPLQFKNENVPQNILPSSGNYEGGIFLFFHKGFSDYNSRIVLINRSGFSVENGVEYKYGNYYYTSVYYIYSLSGKISLLGEIRNEIQERDRYERNLFEDSGGYSFYFTPQINYTYQNWNFSILGDIPIYQYYNGSQLGKQFSVSFNINWEISFNPDDHDQSSEEYNDN